MVFVQSNPPDAFTAKDTKRRSTPLPLMLDDEDVVIAPWDSQNEDDVAEDQVQRKQRIGLLPSPALDGSWAAIPNIPQESQQPVELGADEKLHGATAQERRSLSEPLKPRLHDANPVENLGVSVPEKDLYEDLGNSAESQPPEEQIIHTLPEQGTTAPGIADNDDGTQIGSSGSVRRTPQQGHISHFVDPELSRRSSVSSMGSGDVNDIVPSTVQRAVSPVQQEPPAQLLQSVLHTPAIPSSTNAQEPQDSSVVLPKEQRDQSSQQRPQESRRASRSSLPSQQRSRDQRQSSWTRNPVSSTAVPSSLDPGAGEARLDSPTVPDRIIAPYNPQDTTYADYAASPDPQYTSQTLHGQGMAIASDYGSYPAESTPAHIGQEGSLVASIGDVPVILTASGNEQEEQSSRSLPAGEPQAISYEQTPGVPDGYQQNFMPSREAELPHPYEQSARFSPRAAASQEDIHGQRFGPAVMDPRQQAAEYQLPGVGPPQDAPKTPRGINFFRSGGSQNQQKNTTQVGAERINPNSMARLHERTFSGDVIPQVQNDESKKDKRRSGIFSAFSRTSSVSDGRQSRVNPSKNTEAQPATSSQSTDPALIAAQKAGETTARGNVLKKVQRSSTSASLANPNPEKKQNRFSRLGSIFGRSNTNSEARKGNKLVKSMPKSENRVSTPPGSMANKSAYQGMQRSTSSVPQLSSGQYPAQALEDPTFIPPENLPAPPGGWYAPTSRRSSYTGEQQPTLPQVQPSPQQSTRRLHSEGYRRYNNTTPDAFRALESPSRQGPQVSERQRLNQQYEQAVSPQATSYRTSPGPMHPGIQPRASNGYGPQRPPGGPPPRNFSYSSGLSQLSQADPQYYQQAEYPARRQASFGVAASAEQRLTPTHSRNSSGGYGAAPPQNYRMSITDQDLESMGPPARPDASYLQQASSPALYGITQPYQVPPPPPPQQPQPVDAGSAPSSPYGRRASPSWYAANYTHQPGPVQQASTPGMYYTSSSGAAARPKTPLGPGATAGPSSRAGSRNNSISAPLGSRPNSILEGQVYQFAPPTPQQQQQQQFSGPGYSPVRYPVVAPQERYYSAQPVVGTARGGW
ncbi:hypothetical protein MBLNU459_g3994t1 [Dothideomycetes sp. NU459]